MTGDPHDTTGQPPYKDGVEHVISDVEQAFNDFADSAKQTVDAVNKRAGRDIFMATGMAILILAGVGACLLWFHWGIVLIAAAAVPGAQVEFGRALTKHREARIVYPPLVAGSVLFIIGAYVSQVYPQWFPETALLWIIGLTIIVILLWRLFGPVERYVADVTSTVFLLGYPCLLFSALVFLLARPQGAALIATYVVGIAASDTGGYFMGVLIGKHPMAPRISPKKSWEGVVGSFLLSGIGVVLMVVFMLKDSWWKGVLLAVVLVVVGILGDLVESVIKRDLGVKDLGTLIPGHGGLMDRLDSYILAAIPAWLTMTWLFPYV